MPANLHVRNVSDEVVARLKRRAAENGRSAEAEHRAALERAFGEMSREEWDRRAEALSEQLKGHTFLQSEDLVREDRDTR
jgi:plasmid stability protein